MFEFVITSKKIFITIVILVMLVFIPFAYLSWQDYMPTREYISHCQNTAAKNYLIIPSNASMAQTNDLVKKWVKIAVNDLFPVNFQNYKEKLTLSCQYFTTQGYHGMIKGVIGSRWLYDFTFTYSVMSVEVGDPEQISCSSSQEKDNCKINLLPVRTYYQSPSYNYMQEIMIDVTLKDEFGEGQFLIDNVEINDSHIIPTIEMIKSNRELPIRLETPYKLSQSSFICA